jgi:ABC-type lipopolysaccharide export system ATPase subunit
VKGTEQLPLQMENQKLVKQNKQQNKTKTNIKKSLKNLLNKFLIKLSKKNELGSQSIGEVRNRSSFLEI